MTKSKKNLHKKRKTKRSYRKNSSTAPIASRIVHVFLYFLYMIKLYHWKTRSYSKHKATDELYGQLNTHVDRFVEVLLGKDQTRLEYMEKDLELINTDNMSEVKARIFEYRNFLIDFNQHFDKDRDSDLLNIRDEILADINQFLYLLSFDQI